MSIEFIRVLSRQKYDVTIKLTRREKKTRRNRLACTTPFRRLFQGGGNEQISRWAGRLVSFPRDFLVASIPCASSLGHPWRTLSSRVSSSRASFSRAMEILARSKSIRRQISVGRCTSLIYIPLISGFRVSEIHPQSNLFVLRKKLSKNCAQQ